MTGHRWRRTAGHTRYTGQGHAGQTQRFEDMYGRGALGWRSRHVHQHDMEKTKADASCLYMNICLSLYTATDRRTYSYRPAVSSSMLYRDPAAPPCALVRSRHRTTALYEACVTSGARAPRGGADRERRHRRHREKVGRQREDAPDSDGRLPELKSLLGRIDRVRRGDDPSHVARDGLLNIGGNRLGARGGRVAREHLAVRPDKELAKLLHASRWIGGEHAAVSTQR